MAITYDNPEVNAMGISPIDRSRINGEIQPQNTLAQRVQAERLANTPTPSVVMNPKLKFSDTMFTGAEASNPERALDQSNIDEKIDWNYSTGQSNDIGDLRAEAQGHWGRLKTATMNNITILGTSLASDVVSLTGGLLSAAIQGDASKIWDNDATNYLNDVQRNALNRRQIYRGQDYENRSALGRLGTGIFWADLWQNAGYMEGMLIPGMAVGKLAQATKLLAKAPMLTKVGTNTIAAIGEASMEAMNQKKDSEKELLQQADMLFRKKLLEATTYQEKDRAYEDYYNDLAKIQDDVVKIGNRTFAGNVALLTATGTIEFGDFVSRGYAESHKLLQQIARDASGKAIGRSIFNSAARGLGQTAKNFWAEGFEEYAQRSLASGAARTKKANSFLEKYQDELNIELADNYLTAVGEDLLADLENPEAWTEFLSGALMGSIGIPGSHNGLISNLKDSYREGKKIENLANEVNKFELENQISHGNYNDNGKAQAMFDALIRHAGINEVQNQALIDRDKKAFVDSRVEKVLNMAYLYDNIGEIDEFKKRLEWYSKIENDEQLEQLINQTQEVEKDENGQIRSVIKSSPFAGLSKEEVNQKLKETNEFYKKIVDDYIEGKNFIDDSTAGKLDDETLKRGAAAYAQAKNWESRVKELYKPLSENIEKYIGTLEKDTSENGVFVKNFFDKIKNLSDNDIITEFSSAKMHANIISVIEYARRNSNKLSADFIKDIIDQTTDISIMATDYNLSNKEVNDIIKDGESAMSKTKRLTNKIKNIKRNYLVRKYAKQLSNINNKEQFESAIKNLPSDLKDNVIEYVKNNGNEIAKQILNDVSEWNNALNAITKALETYDEKKFPITRGEANNRYGEEIVSDVISEFSNSTIGVTSMDEFNEKIDNNNKIRRDSLSKIIDKDEFKKADDELKKRLAFTDELRKKIGEFYNEEKKSNEEIKKKNKSKKEDLDNFDDVTPFSQEIDTAPIPAQQSNINIPSYVIPIAKQNIIENSEESRDTLKNIILANLKKDARQYYASELDRAGDSDGSKNIKFIEDFLNGNLKDNNSDTSVDLSNQPKGTTNIQYTQDRFGVNNTQSMTISKYNHDEAAKGIEKLFEDGNNPIYKLLEGFGAYDFVDNGGLNNYKEYLEKNNKRIDNVVKYIKTKINYEGEQQNLYLLALEVDDYLKDNGITKLNVDGKNYQIIGTLAYFKNESKSINEWNKLTGKINSEIGDVNLGQYKVSQKYANGIKKINAGRLVYVNDGNTEIPLKELLSNISTDEFEIGSYGNAGELILNEVAESKRGIIVEPSVESNASAKSPGTTYLFVKCADGRYYPRQIRAKKFRASELSDDNIQYDPWIKYLKDKLNIIADIKLSDEKRAAARGQLRNIIPFGTINLEKYIQFGINPDRSQWLRIGYQDGNHKLFFDNDITGENLYNELIRDDRDEIFGPSINVRTKEYEGIKKSIKSGIIITSNVRMKSIDCNFELFTTDDNGVPNIEQTIDTSSSKSGSRIQGQNKVISLTTDTNGNGNLGLINRALGTKYKNVYMVQDNGTFVTYIDGLSASDRNYEMQDAYKLMDWFCKNMYILQQDKETNDIIREFYNPDYGVYLRLSKTQSNGITISEVSKKYKNPITNNESANGLVELNFDNNSEQQQSVQQEQQEQPKNAWTQNDNPQNFTDQDMPFHVEIQDMDIDSDCWEEAIRCNK